MRDRDLRRAARPPRQPSGGHPTLRAALLMVGVVVVLVLLSLAPLLR